MTAKRRWFCKKYSDSQESNDGKADISWSSSNSDSENEPNNKKLKVKSPNWIKLIKTTSSSSSNDDVEDILGPNRRETKISPTPDHNKSEFVIQDFSPDNVIQTDSIEGSSPVIGGKNVLKKIRNHLKLMRENKITEIITPPSNSPELFSSQSNVIIDSSSPVNLELKSTISPANSENSPEYEIDSDSQPGSSPINIISNSDSSSAANSDPRLLLYHQPPPKKSFKKGGIRSQLEKALNRQKSSLAIWQHEIYLNKSKDDIPSCSSQEGNNYVEFCIKSSWKEYGCTVLECEYARNYDNSGDNNLFLLIVGFNVVPNISFSLGSFYKMLPPFDVKFVKYKSKETKCYYNVCKIVKC